MMDRQTGRVLTAFGVIALTFMMMTYGPEHLDRAFALAFTVGCALSSDYGSLSGAWPRTIRRPGVLTS